MAASFEELRRRYSIEFSDGVSAGAEKAASGMRKLADAVEKSGEGAKRALPSWSSTERALDTTARLTAQLDQIQRKYSATLEVLNQQRVKGLINEERESNLIQEAAVKREQAIQRVVAAAKRQEEASKRASAAIDENVLRMTAHERAAMAMGNGLETVATATNSAAIGMDRLNAKYNPTLASVRLMTAELAALNQAMKNGKITEDAYVTMQSKIINNYNLGAVAATRMAEARAKLIAQARAEQIAANNQNFFNTSMRSRGDFGTITVDPNSGRDFSRDLRLQMENAAKGVDTLDHSTRGLNSQWANLEAGMLGATQGSRAMQFAVTNLSFQVNDVVSGLAMGQQPWRIFTQQAGQFVQAFQQGGGVGPVMKEVAATLTRMITPTTVLAGGLGVLAAAFGVLLWQAQRAENAISDFNFTLEGTGRAGESTGERLLEVEKSLRTIGFSARDARSAIMTVLRTPGINANAARDLAISGRTLGQIRGTTTDEGIQALLTTSGQGSEAILKLGVDLGRFDLAMVRSIRNLRETNGELVATNTAYRELSNSLLLTQKPVGDLAQAWQDFKNIFIEAGVSDFITTQLRWLKEELIFIINLIKGAVSWASNIGSYIPGGRTAARLLFPRMNQNLVQTAEPQTRSSASSGFGISSVPSPTGAQGEMRLTITGINIPNTPDFDRLAQIAAEATRILPPGYRAEATSGFRPGDKGLHGQGRALDIQIIDPRGRPLPNSGPFGVDPGLYKDFAIAAYWANERIFPGTDLTWGGRFETSPGSGRSDWMHLDTAPDRGTRFGVPPLAELARQDAEARARSTSPSATAADAPNVRDLFTAQETAARKALEQDERDWEKRAEAMEKYYHAERVYREAFNAGMQEALQKPELRGYEVELATQKAEQAVKELNIELDRNIRIEDERLSGVQRTIQAFEESSAAGFRSTAAEQARIEAVQTGIDEQVKFQQILEDSALSAILTSQQQIAAEQPRLRAAEQIVEAARNGALAQKEAEQQAKAAEKSQDALAKAEASRNPVLIEMARALDAAALAEVKRKDATDASLQNILAIRQEEEQHKTLGLQLSLVGETNEAVNAQLNLLRTRNELDKAGNDLTEKEKQDRLASVEHTNALTIALADARREQQRMEDMFKSIASTIENEITKNIEDAFKGDTVEAWGDRVKRLLGQLQSQITRAFFIQPLMGEIAGLFGMPSVAQGFGTFGGTGGGTGTGTGASGGLGTLSSGTGLLRNIFGMSSGSGSFFTGGIFGAPASVTGTGFGSTTSLGGLFSTSSGAGMLNMSLGGFASGVAGGFGAGSFINSLIGGNPLTGSIGSGIGSLAGTALLGPVGGLIGGALGGLFGLFGNRRPANRETGAFVDLSTGVISDWRSSGVAENDANARTITRAIRDFSITAQSLSGGTISGFINPDVGSRDGIQLNFDIAGLGAGTEKVASVADAIDVSSLKIARGLTGVSEVMKTVIDQITDARDLERGMAFAAVYDDIKTAFDDAFTSIDVSLKTIGPFSVALDEINFIFDDLIISAREFGLALAPINGALDEATRRLRESFGTALDRGMFEAQGRDFLNQLQDIIDAYVVNISEAQYIGLGDSNTLDRLEELFEAQAEAVLSLLEISELDDVIEQFTGLNDNMVRLAETAKAAAIAAEDLARAQADTDSILRSGIRIREYLNSLESGTTFTSPESALAAARETYAETLAGAELGDPEAYAYLITATDALIKNLESFYGSSEEGVLELARIKDELAALAGVPASVLSKDEIDRATIELLTLGNTNTSTLITTTENLITVTNSGQAALLSANLAASEEAIANNNARTEELKTANDEAAARIIGQNKEDAERLIESNNTGTEGIIENAKTAKDELIANNNSMAETLAEGNRISADALIEANNQAAIDIIAQNSDAAAKSSNEIVEAIYGAANSQIDIGAYYSNNEISAVFDAATSTNDALAYYLNNNIDAIHASAVAVIDANLLHSNNTIEAIYGGANSIIEAGNAYSNSNLDAINGVANSMIDFDRVLADNNINAIYATAKEITDAIEALMNVAIADGDRAIEQRDMMIALLRQIRDKEVSQGIMLPPRYNYDNGHDFSSFLT